MNVEFTDNSIAVKAALNEAAITYLYDAAETMTSQAADNTRVDSGNTKGAWKYKVDEEKGIATVGNPLQNAIWEEYGTGEYALNGDGKKGGWRYRDFKEKWHFTYGKKPNRALHNAFVTLKSALIRRAEEVLKGRME